MGAEFVRGRVCQGPSLFGAEMSRNRKRELSFFLSLLVRSYMSITPGSANLEILIK